MLNCYPDVRDQVMGSISHWGRELWENIRFKCGTGEKSWKSEDSSLDIELLTHPGADWSVQFWLCEPID